MSPSEGLFWAIGSAGLLNLGVRVVFGALVRHDERADARERARQAAAACQRLDKAAEQVSRAMVDLASRR